MSLVILMLLFKGELGRMRERYDKENSRYVVIWKYLEYKGDF